MLTEERVREIAAGDAEVGTDYASIGDDEFGFPDANDVARLEEEAKQLAADWLALRAQNAALRAMVEAHERSTRVLRGPWRI